VGSNLGTGSSRARFGIAFATRGVSGSVDGRGAPSRLRIVLILALSGLALLILPVAQASALITVNFAGPGTGTVILSTGGNKVAECSNTPGKEKLGPANCTGNFTVGAVVAVPDVPFIMGPWSGSEVGPCSTGFQTECNINGAGPSASLTVTFNALPPKPQVTTGAASNVTNNQASLAGDVNPSSGTYGIIRCSVEYGTSTAYGKFGGCQPTTIGAGTSTVPVTVQLGVLAPSTTYHYRLTATNVTGSTVGADRTFTTSSASADPCSNGGIRLQQGSFFLPECRAYEMVSPPYKQTQEAYFGFGAFKFNNSAPMSPDGDAVAWTSLGLFGGAESSANGSTYLSTRGADGWETVSTNAPFSVIGSGGTLAALNKPAVSKDKRGLAACGYASASAGTGETDAYLPTICAVRNADGSWRATPELIPYDNYASGGSTSLGGASDDLSSLVVRSGRRLLPVDTATAGSPTLYDVFTESPTSLGIRVINVDNGGSLIAGSNPALGRSEIFAYRAISADGSRIFFTVTSPGGIPTLYARSNGTTTTTVSNPSPAECTSCSPTPAAAEFWGASEDGSRVFFTTTQQLVNADSDTTNDLYMYDFAAASGHHLTQVSGGGAGDLTPGIGAQVNGVAAVSEDGSHTYFLAKDVLTTLPNALGQSAASGAENLYVYERDSAYPAGRTRFVATVSSADASALLASFGGDGQATSDGRYFAFPSDRQLISSGPEVDTDSVKDVYRYDAATGSLIRISVGRADYPASNNGNTPGMGVAFEGPERVEAKSSNGGQVVSADGSYIVFNTAEKLQADDVNGGSSSSSCFSGDSPGCDVYLWHDGQVSLISDGVKTGGSSQTTGRGRVSESGTVVAFATYTQLVPQDTDQLSDLYMARIDGGFPYTPPAPRCESNEACHGSPPGPPPGEAVGGSSSFNGPGNQPPPAKPKKKHKKQHGKKKQHKKKATKQASKQKKTSTRGNG
jgi:hypothetical protein